MADFWENKGNVIHIYFVLILISTPEILYAKEIAVSFIQKELAESVASAIFC